MKNARIHFLLALLSALAGFLFRHDPPVWPALGWFCSGFSLSNAGHALAECAAAAVAAEQRQAAKHRRPR